jgi:hypothetical protein
LNSESFYTSTHSRLPSLGNKPFFTCHLRGKTALFETASDGIFQSLLISTEVEMAYTSTITTPDEWNRTHKVLKLRSDRALFIFTGRAIDNFLYTCLLEKVVDVPAERFLFFKVPVYP